MGTQAGRQPPPNAGVKPVMKLPLAETYTNKQIQAFDCGKL